MTVPTSINNLGVVFPDGTSQITTSNAFVTPERWGAVGDGVHDDTKAFQDAIDSIRADWGGTGGVIRLTPGKKYYIGTGITVGMGVSIESNRMAQLDHVNRIWGQVYNATWSNNVATLYFNDGGVNGGREGNFSPGQLVVIQDVNPGGYNGTYIVTAAGSGSVSYAKLSDPGTYVSGGFLSEINDGCLLIDPGSGHTINLLGRAGIKGCVIRRANFCIPNKGLASAWTGTGIYISGSDNFVIDCSIWGFATGIYADQLAAGNPGRSRIFNNGIDCNVGVMILNSLDTCYIEFNHCFPICSSHYSSVFNTHSWAWRDIGFAHLGTVAPGGNDHTKYTNNFCINCRIGFKVAGCWNTNFVACGADMDSAYAIPGSVGFQVEGESHGIHWTSCQASGHKTGQGFLFSGGNDKAVCMMTGCSVWSCATGILKQGAGYLYVTGTLIETCDYGYNNSGSSGKAIASNMLFDRTKYDDLAGYPIETGTYSIPYSSDPW